jgi:hypothetical protein
MLEFIESDALLRQPMRRRVLGLGLAAQGLTWLTGRTRPQLDFATANIIKASPPNARSGRPNSLPE